MQITINESGTDKECRPAPKYAQVLVDIPELDTRTFSYLIPEELQEIIKVGLPVLVPFGNRGAVNAYVVGFGNYLPEGIKAKSIYEALDTEPLFDMDYLQFAERVANYYCCSLQHVLECAIPSNFFAKTKRIVSLKSEDFSGLKINKNLEKILLFLKEKPETSVSWLQRKTKITSSAFYETLRKLKKADIIEINNITEAKSAKHKYERYIKLSEAYDKEDQTPLTKKQQEILSSLNSFSGEYKLSEFLKEAQTTAATVKKIADAGYIEIFEKEVFRNPLKIFDKQTKDDFLILNKHQQTALDEIISSMESNNPEPMLLYGITGSGKTEVYLHAIAEALKQNKNTIILAPEILLATQLAKRISARFGSEKVSLWHSNISEGERYDVWKRIKNNTVKIIVGARSAIFAPVKNLGLIVIDEEHESSYKQTSPVPRYNAKTLAYERAKKVGAAVVLGSATPDIVTYYRAKNTGRILQLPERFGSGELAQVSVIDMREEYNTGHRSIFSRALKHNLVKTVAEGKQALILLNRRGFSTSAQCQSCGHVSECKSCSIPLILHKTTGKLRCHYCSYERNAYDACPECGSTAVKYSGLGTQRAEEMFIKEFPKMRVARIDSDIMTKKNAHIEIMEAFSNGEIDVLIGTQMIAKGIDIPNVTLVGVLSADSLFKMPDYRAGERGFQLLTQVAGRAGRGDFKGKVYFQTYAPDFFAINHAKAQDFTSFYYYEIQGRNELSYPPFGSLIRLIISNESEIKAHKISEEIAYKLRILTDSRGLTERLEVLGPTPCIISRLKGEYRFHILIKNTMGENGHLMITDYLKGFNLPADIKFLIDVDPSDML